MADGEGQAHGEDKVCTKKCTLITVSVITLVAVLAGVIVAVVILTLNSTGSHGLGPNERPLMSTHTLSRRTLNRFRRNHPDNGICWDRKPEEDSFFSIIDTHNHFRPFGGPSVPFDTYFQWMEEAGMLFSTMFGIGQLIKKKNPADPDCCYYLHCPTFEHLVVPDPFNDRKNAEDYEKYMQNINQTSKIHLTLSATFPNLQKPEQITTILSGLEKDFPNAFKWAGEINVIKHALVGNGFFKDDTSPRITKQFLDNGNLDPFFQKMENVGWPVTIHCDCGCDQYDAIPKGAFDKNPIKGCNVPHTERIIAHQQHGFWKELLGEFYPAFFYQDPDPSYLNHPNVQTFKKVQHLQLMDTILTRYPRMKVVWAHMCLNKELLSLHPRVHSHIMEYFLQKYDNLYIDLSWDVLAKLKLLNYNEMEDVSKYSSQHSDIHAETSLWNNTHIYGDNGIEALRTKLHEKWAQISHIVHASGSFKTLSGPTYAFVIYLELMKKFPDRFLTGTDFVSSMGDPEDYPGLQRFKDPPSGCMKDQANHKRQVTDTSAVNIFFDNNVFKKVVLGENYFKITGLDSEFSAPNVC